MEPRVRHVNDPLLQLGQQVEAELRATPEERRHLQHRAEGQDVVQAEEPPGLLLLGADVALG